MDNRLRGWISKEDVGVMSPFIEFDQEITDNFPKKRFNIGSNSINKNEQDYYNTFNMKPNVKLNIDDIINIL